MVCVCFVFPVTVETEMNRTRNGRTMPNSHSHNNLVTWDSYDKGELVHEEVQGWKAWHKLKLPTNWQSWLLVIRIWPWPETVMKIENWNSIKMSPFAICVLISNIFGLVTYSLDVYSDLALGIYWFRMGHSNWGAATLAFFFIPGAINSVLGRLLSPLFCGGTRLIHFR